MATYEQPNYLKNNQFIPTFNSLNFSEPNDNPSSGGNVNLSDLDNRYLKKISDDTTTYNLTSTGTVTANSISCNDISISSTSYKVSRYSGNSLYYNGTTPVYLQVSLTLEPNINWLVSYIGTSFFLYGSSPATVFLSTLDDSGKITNPFWSDDVKNARILYSNVTMKGSGVSTVLTYFTPANQILLNFATTTTIYAYVVANTTPPGTTDLLYKATTLNGGFPDPDGYIVLSALRIR
jgi:hypothetical protein